MIIKEELRFGNLFKAGNEVRTVNLEQLIKIQRMPVLYIPIPLTEDWHNKFGVNRNGFDNFEYVLPEKNNFSIRIVFNGDYVMLRQGSGARANDDIVSIWNKDLTKRDMYVHEWQNLYYALTNKELTIKQ